MNRDNSAHIQTGGTEYSEPAFPCDENILSHFHHTVNVKLSVNSDKLSFISEKGKAENQMTAKTDRSLIMRYVKTDRSLISKNQVNIC